MANLGDHAVVLGASIGGLLAARVLSEHYHTRRAIHRDLPGAGAADDMDPGGL
ncbi:hypothetical protein ACXPWS_22415 [Mycobacterium sp. BMJ-28]